MSGVFGIVDVAGATDIERLSAVMARRMSHREWYLTETHVDTSQGVAFGRIGIGIFNHDIQPVWNASRTIALMMTGELYNTAALKREAGVQSDEALALWLYENQGGEFAAQLDGQFVIAVWDVPRQQMTIVNDRFGLYPTYYSRAGRAFIFAPEVKAVLAYPAVGCALRDDAVAEFVFFQHLLGAKTFFEGVNMLPPACVLRFRAGEDELKIERYWSLPQVAPPRSFEAAVEEGAHLLRASVAKMSSGPERIGVFLSGGLDGRTILGLAPHNRDVHTFTFGQHGCRDVVFAQQLAKAAGTQHHYYPYKDGRWIEENADFHFTLTEGFHPFIHMHGIHMLGDVRKHVDVNLSGLGDLLWLQGNFAPRHLLCAPDDLAFCSVLFDLYSRKYTWPGLTSAEERLLYDDVYYSHVRGLAFESFMCELKALDGLPYPQRLAEFNLVNHFLRYIHNSAVMGRSHIEFRFPYFDPALMAFCVALPHEMAEDRAVQKAIIMREMPHLAAVPTSDDEMPLTDHKVKHMAARVKLKLQQTMNRYVAPIFSDYDTLYADYEQWMRTDLRQWAEGILFSERATARHIFRPEAVRSLFDRHMAGQELWTIGKIAPLITFEMMLCAFIDGVGALLG